MSTTRAVSDLAVLSPKPTVAKTVTLKYRASVRVSGSVKFAAGLVPSGSTWRRRAADKGERSAQGLEPSHSRVARLRDNGQLAKNGLVEISEFTGTADADIEDLVEPDFYLELVNAAYHAELTKLIVAADLNANDLRIVRQIAPYFAANNVADGKFNRYRPAAALLRKQASLTKKINKARIDRAKNLVARLNGLLS